MVGIANILGALGKGLYRGGKVAGMAANTSGGRSLLGGAAKMAAGYGVMKGSFAAADYMDSNSIPGVGIGGFYTGALRVAGAIGGGSMMATGAARGVGRAASAGINASVRGGMINSHKVISALGKVRSYTDRMSNFSTGGTLLKGISKGKKYAGKGAWAMGRGIGMAPVAVGSDIAGTLMGGAATRAGRAAYGVGNKYIGARMFGWGAALGGAKLGAELNMNLSGSSDSDQMYNLDETNQSLAGRSMALQGQQMYVPTSGSRPRRMDANATAGLTQSLHRLR